MLTMTPITLTEAAHEHMVAQLKSRGSGTGIRLGVRPSGCSGMAYVLEFEDNDVLDDMVYNEGGIKIYIDAKSMHFLQGTELDFVREGLNEGLCFNNPNVKNECGCGESFQV